MRLSRDVEGLSALGVGFTLNLVLAVADARAGALGAVQLVAQTYAFAGGLGGLVAGLVHFAAIGLNAERTDPVLVRRAGLEMGFSVIVGAIVAHYLTSSAARALPKVDGPDLLSVAFGLGVLAWRLAPGILSTAKLLFNPKLLKGLILRWLNAKPIEGEGQ